MGLAIGSKGLAMLPRYALVLGACVVLAAALDSSADTVVCVDGRVIEGEVEVQGDTVVIKGKFGRTTIPRAEVLEIKKGGSEDEYRKKLEELEKSDKAKDAEAHFALGKWAKGKGLNKQAEERFKRAIELDPDHEGAREALGYVKYLGQWMLEEDAMRAKGMVKVQGKWMTPAEAEAFLNKKSGADSKPADPQAEPKKIAPEVGETLILVKCPTCNGVGFIPSQLDCRRCKGAGFLYNDGVQVICNNCRGTGKAGQQCLSCRGSGKIWKKQ
ncbi:MAG: hypothetical protein N3A38_08610 [Planctomycetota bacterium]|nr:hypothetical protein [Planctomycetota bacterium]